MLPALALWLCGLVGCAPSASRFQGVTLHDNDALLVSGVPPIMQADDTPCGPACLASVAAYWSKPVSAGRLRECLGAKADQMAHSGDDLAAAARALGLDAYVFQGQLDDLDANLARGRPLIVLIRRRPLGALGELGLGATLPERIAAAMMARKQHWIVVVGTDRAGIIAHDPALGMTRFDKETFDSWWAGMARLCVLVTPAQAEGAPLTRTTEGVTTCVPLSPASVPLQPRRLVRSPSPTHKSRGRSHKAPALSGAAMHSPRPSAPLMHCDPSCAPMSCTCNSWEGPVPRSF
jgi:predicted double-glycine peptidase